MTKPPVEHRPPDSAEYLAGPLPRYPDPVFVVHGKRVDASKLKPIDPGDVSDGRTPQRAG